MCSKERKGERKSGVGVGCRRLCWTEQPSGSRFNPAFSVSLPTALSDWPQSRWSPFLFFFSQHTLAGMHTGAYSGRHVTAQQWDWNVTVVIVILMNRKWNKPMSCWFTTAHTNTVTQTSYKVAKKMSFVSMGKFGPGPKLKGNDRHKVISHQWTCLLLLTVYTWQPLSGVGNVKHGQAMLDVSHPAFRQPLGLGPWGDYRIREKPRTGRLPVRKPLSDQPSPGESLYRDQKAVNWREGEKGW